MIERVALQRRYSSRDKGLQNRLHSHICITGAIALAGLLACKLQATCAGDCCNCGTVLM